MVRLANVGLVGAVLCFVCLVGLLSTVLLSLPTLVIGQDKDAYMNGVYVSIGFGTVAFLGLLLYMVSLILGMAKEKEG
jgi:hypothetical protein